MRCRFYFAISMAYFLGDILVCLVMFREYGSLFMLHAVCGLVGLAIICLGNQVRRVPLSCAATSSGTVPCITHHCDSYWEH